ncbi:MAG: hypothetical protein R2865_12990 [Deinococcales bacterium]
MGNPLRKQWKLICALLVREAFAARLQLGPPHPLNEQQGFDHLAKDLLRMPYGLIYQLAENKKTS